MIYETNLKKILIILTAAKLGGFNVKTDFTTIQRAWSYVCAISFDKIPQKTDHIAFLQKEEFLQLLQRIAPEKIEKSGKLTSYYKKILKQSIKFKLLKPFNKKENFNAENKKDKFYVLSNNGNLFFLGAEIIKEFILNS